MPATRPVVLVTVATAGTVPAVPPVCAEVRQDGHHVGDERPTRYS